MFINVILLCLLFFLLASAIYIAVSKDILACVIVSCAFSFVIALVYMVMNAVDVAITEAAVGSGLNTVFMLSALAKVKNRFSSWSIKLNATIFILLAIFCYFMIESFISLPIFGDRFSPIHNVIVPYYFEHSFSSIGISNVVTSILSSFRGYDTFGESVVVFIAGVGIASILKDEEEEIEHR